MTKTVMGILLFVFCLLNTYCALINIGKEGRAFYVFFNGGIAVFDLVTLIALVYSL